MQVVSPCPTLSSANWRLTSASVFLASVADEIMYTLEAWNVESTCLRQASVKVVPKLILGNSRSGKAERKVSPADLRSECMWGLPETDNLGFDVMVQYVDGNESRRFY